MMLRLSRFGRNPKMLAAALAPASLLSLGLLGGCAMSTGNTLAPDAVISGRAMGGRQPVIGAAIKLYATGNTGYGSAATLIGSATTDSGGNFTISRTGTCSDPQELYMVATGGDPGGGANTASVMVNALGGCSSITGSTGGIVINELTTLAAAYALQGFADTTTNIGTSSTNAQGLQHGFANAANLVSINGQAQTTTVGGNGTVPTSLLNTLANILASCVNSNGPASAACSAILVGAPTVVAAPTPTNVWQEALNMARYPGYQTTALYGAAAASAAYQPTLAAQPNDLSVGIAYQAGYRTDGTTLASFTWDVKADAYDNIWVSGMSSVGLAELSSTGKLLSPSAGGWGTSTLQADGTNTHGIGIDTTGNIFVADSSTTGGGSIWKYTPAGTPTAPTAGTTTQIAASAPVGGPYGLAVDSANNVWFGNYVSTANVAAGIGEVVSGGSSATYPANSPYSSTAVKGAYTLFVDAANSNKVYAGSQSAGVVYEYLTTAAPTATTSLGSSATNGLAADASGNLWVVYTASGSNGGTLSKYVPGSVTPAYSCKVTVSGGAGMYNPRGLVIDGNGRMFVTSYTTPGIVEFDPALGTACDTASDPGTFFTTSIGNGFNPVNSAGTGLVATSGARSETIDSSGALWAGNSVASTIPVIQILGIAAPVNPVLAAGKYGVKP